MILMILMLIQLLNMTLLVPGNVEQSPGDSEEGQSKHCENAEIKALAHNVNQASTSIFIHIHQLVPNMISIKKDVISLIDFNL